MAFSAAAYGAGLSVGLGLLVAIGPQNAFVLKQGIARAHIVTVVAVCIVCDILLITLGGQFRHGGQLGEGTGLLFVQGIGQRQRIGIARGGSAVEHIDNLLLPGQQRLGVLQPGQALLADKIQIGLLLPGVDAMHHGENQQTGTQ